MALGASVYKMIFDTQGLQSVTASRRELALQKKIMEETTPAVEKLSHAQTTLDRLVQKNLISDAQRNQALAKVRGELMGTTTAVSGLNTAHLNGVPMVGKFASTLSSLGPIGITVAAAVGGVTIAAKLMSAAIDTTITNVSEQIDKIDDLINASENIDVPVDQFQRLSHAADLADISQDKFASGTEAMLINISKGADGSKKFVDAFNLIGLDVRRLSDMKPEQAFRNITAALDRVPNSADRARAAAAIFGDADFMRIDTSHIDRANSLMDQLRANLDETDASVFGEFDANVTDMNAALDVTWQKLAMEIVPALGDAAKLATEWLVALNQSEAFTDTLTIIGDSLTAIVAVSREMPSVIESWIPAIDKAAQVHTNYLKMIAGASPWLSAAANVGTAIGEEAGSARDDIATQVRRQRELDAQLDARMKSAAESAKQDAEAASAIETESESIQKLIDKLKEEVATKGMSVAMAKVWKLEQLGASEEVLLQNQLLAEEYDRLAKAEKAAKAVEAFTESLRHQGETAGESARRLADLKLKNEGVDDATRQSLMAQYDASEAQKAAIETQKKAAAEAQKHADAVEGLGESIAKQTAKLQGYNDASGKHEDRVRAGERAVLAWQLAHDKADAATTAATLGHFDAATALEKRQKATEAATKAQEDFQKLIRQAGMTDDQKQLDDLKAAGVNEEQLKIVATLQKEAALRGAIKQEITATSSVIKAGSRDAADAFAKLNQASVRASFLRNQVPRDDNVQVQRRSSFDTLVNVPAAARVSSPVVPVASSAPTESDKASRAAREHRTASDDLFDRIRNQLSASHFSNQLRMSGRMLPENEWRELSDRINGTGPSLSAADRARAQPSEQLTNRLAGITVTAPPAPPTISGSPLHSPQAMIATQAREQLKETQKTNSLLSKIVENTAPLQIEEVTL